jgi:hypothetical protein
VTAEEHVRRIQREAIRIAPVGPRGPGFALLLGGFASNYAADLGADGLADLHARLRAFNGFDQED